MDSRFVRTISSGYQIATPIFEGPLDLLLFLIEKSQLDITKLSLAEVTGQYLEHIKYIGIDSPNEISEFLIVAAKLLQIKSEALLPSPPPHNEGVEEDLGDTLARQLLEYRKYKNAAVHLEFLEKSGFQTFLRLASPVKIEGTLDLSDISITDLVSSAFNILINIHQESMQSVIALPLISIREKITLISQRLKISDGINFTSLLPRNPTFIEIVITFLAILELMKQKSIFVNQLSLFGEIHIERSDNFTEDATFELDFED